jgi:hypothetical protein
VSGSDGMYLIIDEYVPIGMSYACAIAKYILAQCRLFSTAC